MQDTLIGYIVLCVIYMLPIFLGEFIYRRRPITAIVVVIMVTTVITLNTKEILQSIISLFQ